MKRCGLSFVVLFSMAGLVCAAAVPSLTKGPLSLRVAREIALTANPSVEAVRLRIEAASAATAREKAAYYPTVDVTLGFSHTEEAPASSGGPLADSTQSYSAGVGAEWLLFDGFVRKYRVAASRYAEEASSLAHADAQRLLLQGVAAAFYESLLARESMSIARQDADFNATLRDETQVRFDAGATARSDVLNFEIRATQAESRYVTAEGTYRVAKIALAQLMGLSEGKLPDGVEPEALPGEEDLTIPDLDAEVTYALEHRPDLFAIQTRIDRLEELKKATRGGGLPQIGVEADYGFVRADNAQFNEDRDEALSLEAALSWNVFDGGQRRATCAEYIAGIRELAQQRAALRLDIVVSLRQQVQAVETAKQVFLLQKSIHAMTTEARDLVKKEFSAGRKSLTRLNEVQNDLVQASGALIQARIRFRQALADVEAISARVR